MHSAKAAIEKGDIVGFRGVRFNSYEYLEKFISAVCSAEDVISGAQHQSGDDYRMRFFELLNETFPRTKIRLFEINLQNSVSIYQTVTELRLVQVPSANDVLMVDVHGIGYAFRIKEIHYSINGVDAYSERIGTVTEYMSKLNGIAPTGYAGVAVIK